MLLLTKNQPTPGSYILGLFLSSIGYVIVQIDLTIVNVALPSMGRDLGARIQELQWTIDAYTLALASIMLSAGTMADFWGSKRIFHYGLVIFGFASVCAAAAPTANLLIVSRAIQGVGAAFILPTSLALVSHGARRTGRSAVSAIAWWSALGGTVSAAAPTLGGLLIMSFGWRAIFLVNVPICIIVLLFSRYALTETPILPRRTFDLAGQLLASISFFLGTYAIVAFGSINTRSQAPYAAGLFFACALAFVIVERNAPEPAVDLSIFRNRPFVLGNLLGAITTATLYGAVFAITIYLQNVRGFSPYQSGVALLPFVSLILSNILSERLSRRLSPRIVIALGFFIGAIGFYVLMSADKGTSYLLLLPGLFLIPIGSGIGMPALTAYIVRAVPDRVATASALFGVSRQLGTAVGVAAFGSLMVGSPTQIVSGLMTTLSSGALLRLGAAVVAIITF